MAILSDEEIRSQINDEKLVENGDIGRAVECSYSFVSGVAFVPGSSSPAIEFPGVGNNAEAIVKPGEMIWIRTRERVVIPDSLVGFWWQTNTLSRQGLMLVNMSMVEPGYEGDLACLFVNFGDSNVVIGANTTIAKMVFMELKGKVLQPYGKTTTREQYDKALRDLSINQPSSFLKVGDLAKDLSKAQTDALEEIGKAANEAKADATKAIEQTEADTKRNLETALSDAKADALKSFRDDTGKVVRSSFAVVTLALVVLTIIFGAIDWAKANWLPDVRKLARSEAEKLLQDRVTITATPDSIDKAESKRLIEELTKRLDALEKKK